MSQSEVAYAYYVLCTEKKTYVIFVFGKIPFFFKLMDSLHTAWAWI